MCPAMSVARSGVLSTKPDLAAGCRCCGSDVLSAGLSVTYHTEILQNKIMQTGVELKPFNVHTFVTHLANVFSLTQMYD